VNAILPGCGAVYVGGWFDQAGGQPRENLAALDPTTGAPTSWDPGPDSTVLALARYGPAVYAGGTFSHVDGTGRQRLAALNASDGHLTAFDAGIDALAHGASVHALAATDSALYLGGYFATAGGEARANLAAVNLNSGQALGWDPRPGARVDALALGGGAVYAGGAFESVGATGQRGFAGFGAGAGSPFAAGGCPVSTLNDAGGSVPSAGSPPPFVPPSRAGPVVLRGATVRPTNLVVGRGAPLTVRFVLSRASQVRLLFERQVRQTCRRTGRGAVVPRQRVCMRYVRFASVTARGRKGANRVTFAGLRIAGRRLVPGRYRVVLQPLPAAGAPRSLVYFQVRAARR
jgi:hypothetical protein